MDVDFDETAELGLRRYVRLVTEALGMSGECSYVEADRPFGAYLALDGRLARFPDEDVALLWNERDGWSVALETDSAEDPIVRARMGGDRVPPPHEVAEWVSDVLRGEHDDRPVAVRSTLIGDGVARRLASYAALDLLPQAQRAVPAVL